MGHQFKMSMTSLSSSPVHVNTLSVNELAVPNKPRTTSTMIDEYVKSQGAKSPKMSLDSVSDVTDVKFMQTAGNNMQFIMENETDNTDSEDDAITPFDSNHKVTIGEEMNEQKADDIDLLSLRLWLQSNVKLAEYYNCFVLNGYETLDKIIKKIKDESKLKQIGIVSAEHRMQIMQEIKKLNEEPKYRKNRMLSEGPKQSANTHGKIAKKHTLGGLDEMDIEMEQNDNIHDDDFIVQG